LLLNDPSRKTGRPSLRSGPSRMPVLPRPRDCQAWGQESPLSHALDTNPAESDIYCMRDGGLFPFVIIVSVCIASLGLVPVGSGPYTAVHGPLSALRAQRGFLLLAFAVASVLWLAAAWVFSRFMAMGALGPDVDAGPEAAEFSSVSCSLRC
jgi:hypothetical protein